MANDLATDNIELDKLIIAMQHTDHGFLCFTTMKASGQGEAVNLIMRHPLERSAVFYDCANEKPSQGFSFINKIVKERSDAEVYVLYNFQRLCVYSKLPEFFQKLNFSRDPWANLKKLFVLGMTDDFENKFILHAPDFYSFFMTSFRLKTASKRMYATQNSIRFIYDEEPTVQDRQIAEEIYERLLQEVIRHGNDIIDISEKNIQLYFIFINAWFLAYRNNYLNPPNVLYMVLDTLERNEQMWADLSNFFDRIKIIVYVRALLKQYDRAINYVENRFKTIKKYLPDSDYTVILYNGFIAYLYYKKGDYKNATVWMHNALTHLNSANDPLIVIDVYINSIFLSLAKREFYEAGEYCNKALDFSIAEDNHYLTFQLYVLMSILEIERLDLFTAEEWLNKALSVAESNKYNPAAAYHQLGIVAEERGDIDAAVDFYNKALSLSLEHDDYAALAATYHQLGNVALKKALSQADRLACDHAFTQVDSQSLPQPDNQAGLPACAQSYFEIAEDWYNKSIAVATKTNNDRGMAASYHQLGMIAQERRDYVAAAEWYGKALSALERFVDKYDAAKTYYQLGSAAYESQEFENSKAMYNQALEIFENHNDPYNAEVVRQALARLAYIVPSPA